MEVHPSAINQHMNTCRSKFCRWYLSLVTRKPVFGVFDQVRLKPACSAKETSQSHEIANIETRDIILSRHRTTKVLIRLRGCAGWSAPLLVAYDISRFSHDEAHFILNISAVSCEKRLSASKCSNAHAQPLSKSRDMALCLKLPLVPYIVLRTAKALVRLRQCAGSPEPSLFAYVINTLFSWDGSSKFQTGFQTIT